MVHSGTVDTAIWRAKDGPHRIINEVPDTGSYYRIRLQVSGRLVIEPGALVCFDDDAAGLHVLDRGRLVAAGTRNHPITFRMGHVPHVWSWNMWIEGEAVLSHIQVQDGNIRAYMWAWGERSGRLEADHVISRGSGSGISAARAVLANVVMDSAYLPPWDSGPAVHLHEGATVDGLFVRDAANVGLLISGSSTVTRCEITGSGRDGVRTSGTDVRIHDCNIHGNAGVGLTNSRPDQPVDARHNWWGDPEGPFGPNGNGVEGNVIFEPWRTEPVPLDDPKQ